MMFQRKPAECRRFLAEALAEAAGGGVHATECAPCRELLARSARLAIAVAAKPAVPRALLQREFLDGLYELVIDGVERDARGEALASAIRRAPPSSGEEMDLFENSQLGARVATPVTKQPSVLQWSRMRSGLLSGMRHQPVASHRLRRLALLGLAASAIAYVAYGREQVVTPSEIVFLDLAARPSVEFAIVRGGALR